jgi:hypothetical protein
MKKDISPAFYQCHVMRWAEFEKQKPIAIRAVEIIDRDGRRWVGNYHGGGTVLVGGLYEVKPVRWRYMQLPIA